MAVTYDLGSPCPGDPEGGSLLVLLSNLHYPGTFCIHPRNKSAVARRLALATLHVAYSFQGVDLSHTLGVVNWTGPTFSSVSKSGNQIVLAFDHADHMFSRGTQHCGDCCDSKNMSMFEGLSSDGAHIPLSFKLAQGQVLLDAVGVGSPFHAKCCVSLQRRSHK